MAEENLRADGPTGADGPERGSGPAGADGPETSGGPTGTGGSSGLGSGSGGTASDAATRRQLLKAGVGLGAVGLVGYGYLRSQEEVVAATDGSPVDDVPDRSEFVFSWTGTELLTDDGFAAAVDEELGGGGFDGAGSTAELFETISAATALDPRELGAVAAFGELPRETTNYSGIIFDAETGPQTVRGRLDSTGNLRGTGEYEGQTLWFVGNERLAWKLVFCHLGGNRYALGTNTELEDVIDVRAGDKRRVSGAVTDGLDRVDEGQLRGGFVVPPAAFEPLDLSITTRLAESIEFGSALVSDGTLTVRFVAPNASVASDLDQTLNALGQLDQEDIAAQVGNSPIVAVVLALLEDLTTEVEGSAVKVTVTDGYQLPAIAVRFLLEQALGR